jgi:hypothetical protein
MRMTKSEIAMITHESEHVQYLPILRILYRQSPRTSHVRNLPNLTPDTMQRTTEKGMDQDPPADQDNGREDTVKACQDILIPPSHLWREGAHGSARGNRRETLGGNGENPAPMKGVDGVIRPCVAAGGTDHRVKAGKEAVSSGREGPCHHRHYEDRPR